MIHRSGAIRKVALAAFLLAAGLAPTGCRHVRAPATAAPSATQSGLSSEPPTPANPLMPTPALDPDTGWVPLRPGLERRILRILDNAGQWADYFYMIRLDPRAYRLGIAYHPEPQSLDAWQAETGALIVVNGGYFYRGEDGFVPDGLLIIDGKAMGSSYGDFAGMLAITASGPEIRWLAQKPYDSREHLLGGLQSFPLLVKPGGEIGFPEQYEDHQQARRTVIGQDTSGRILFLLAPEGWFTLHQLSVYLTTADLYLDIALNLDGGPSTGLILADPPETIPSGTPLPIVITVSAGEP